MALALLTEHNNIFNINKLEARPSLKKLEIFI